MTVSSTLPLPEKDFKAVIHKNRIEKVGIEFFEDALAAQPLYKLNKEDWNVWLARIEEFCEKENSMVQRLSTYRNLLIVRAFTKIYAIPGVRLGYLMCSDKELLQKIRGQLPEWNLSVFAEAAGIACLQQQEYLKETVEYVAAERKFLTEKLQNLGLQVILSDANFILFYSEKPLYKKLLQKGILIRDCKNFQGLSEGYYRVAVKSRRENEILEKAIGECIG